MSSAADYQSDAHGFDLPDAPASREQPAAGYPTARQAGGESGKSPQRRDSESGLPPAHSAATPSPEFVRPSEEDERRALRWLMDVRENGGPLDRQYARSIIETLAYFEQEAPVDTRP